MAGLCAAGDCGHCGAVLVGACDCGERYAVAACTSNEWREAESAAITAKAGSESDFYVSPERRAIIFPISRKEQNNDLRDLLIAQQVRRIDELERQVDMLEALLHSGRRGSRASSFLLPKRESGERGLSAGNNDVAPADSDKENRSEDHGEGHGE